MRFWSAIVVTVFGSCFLSASPAAACSICNPDMMRSATIRQDAAQAKLIVYGTLANPRLLSKDPTKTDAATDLTIQTVLKSDPSLANKTVLEIPRYLPVDPKNPPKFLVLCDVFKDKDQKQKINPFRGIPLKSPALVDYLKGAMALEGRDSSKVLLYCFDYLEHREPEVASDAFLEFAKATDQEIGQVASKLSPDRLRGWLQNSETPAHRLGLYAVLLGACGGDKDASLLQSMLEKTNERTTNVMDGLLCGYIRLRPRQGWDLAQAILGDGRRSFLERWAVLRTLRFYHGWKPEETKTEVLRGLEAAVTQGDLADLAFEDLRRWKMWDLTRLVLAQYGKKSHDAPIVRRAIVRYALSCPQPEAARFVEERRKHEPDLVNDVNESLQFEKQN